MSVPSATPVVSTVRKPSASAMLDHSKLLSKQHSDGGWGLVPIQSRAGRFASFDVSEFEPVTGMEMEWRFTPVKLLGAVLNDALDGTRYEYTAETVGDGTAAADLEWVERSDARIGSIGKPEERGSANAWSQFEEALVITVSGEETTETRISRGSLSASPRAAHTFIEAKPHSNGVVIIDSSGSALLSENVEIAVGDGARLTVVSVQEWEEDGIHLATHFAKIGRDAYLKHVVVSLSGSIVRVNTNAHLASEGSDVELLGVYFADAGQHLEQQVFVNHDAPHSKSRVNYRGALQGEKARAVWIGDVLIRPTAPATDSYEENRNLLLTEGTRAESVPNLEIETGEIAGAGHASTSGRFDDEQLFYLQSRGLPEDEARRIVVRAFLSSVIQKIGIPVIQERLESAIEAELSGATVGPDS